MKQLILIATALLISGCSAVREYKRPDPQAGVDTINLLEANDIRFQAADPVIEWWQHFNDPQLNTIMAKALDGNLDIQIAAANYLEARSLAREAGFDRYPTVTTSASYSRLRLSEETISGVPPDNSGSEYAAGLDGFWTLDLYGRVSQTIASQEARRDAAIATLQDVYVSVAAEVARTYIELRGAQHRLAIAERNAHNQEETFKFTQRLAEGGRSTNLDLARARTQLDSTLATIPQLQSEVAAAIHRLSVLTGQIPDALRNDLTAKKPLPSLPMSIAVGDTNSLLKRRPDIRQAERGLASLVAQYNVVAADLFPSVNLIGAIGFIANSLSDSVTGSAIAGNLGPSISWATFDLGRVRARIDQADALTLEALARYEQTVLRALEETQTALSDFSFEEQRRQKLQSAAVSSNEAAILARQRFEAGIDTFLDVLDAERTQLEAEDTLAISGINAAQDLIAIYESLGGGWQMTTLPE